MEPRKSGTTTFISLGCVHSENHPAMDPGIPKGLQPHAQRRWNALVFLGVKVLARADHPVSPDVLTDLELG